MEKIEVRYTPDYSSAPEHLELGIDYEELVKLTSEIEQYEELIKLRPFKITVDMQVYYVPEDHDYRSEMEMVHFFPDSDKSYLDWHIVQRMIHKHSSEDWLESAEFTLRELLDHFGDGKAE